MRSTNEEMMLLPFTEQQVCVTFSYVPGRPGRTFEPNGDPGFPPEPPEIEIESVTVAAGIDIMPALQDTVVELLTDRLYQGLKSGKRDDDC